MKLGPIHLNRLILLQTAIALLSALLKMEEARIAREEAKRKLHAV